MILDPTGQFFEPSSYDSFIHLARWDFTCIQLGRTADFDEITVDEFAEFKFHMGSFLEWLLLKEKPIHTRFDYLRRVLSLSHEAEFALERMRRDGWVDPTNIEQCAAAFVGKLHRLYDYMVSGQNSIEGMAAAAWVGHAYGMWLNAKAAASYERSYQSGKLSGEARAHSQRLRTDGRVSCWQKIAASLPPELSKHAKAIIIARRVARTPEFRATPRTIRRKI